jgi:hypothetical protein
MAERNPNRAIENPDSENQDTENRGQRSFIRVTIFIRTFLNRVLQTFLGLIPLLEKTVVLLARILLENPILLDPTILEEADLLYFNQ